MRAVRIVIGAAVAVVAILLLAQLLLPAIAAHVIRGKVARYGTVHSVSVSAWPAIELAWRHAGTVTVQAGALRMSSAQAVGLLGESGGTATVRAHAQSIEVEGLALTDVTFAKRGTALWAQGTIDAAAIARALPPGVQVALVSSAGGSVRVRASGGLFGVSASLEAVAYARDGALVASPATLLLSGLRITLLDEPSVHVEGVHARALAPGPGGEARYELSMWATLR